MRGVGGDRGLQREADPEHGPGGAGADHGEDEAPADFPGHLRARDPQGRGTGRGVRFPHHQEEDEQDEGDERVGEIGQEQGVEAGLGEGRGAERGDGDADVERDGGECPAARRPLRVHVQQGGSADHDDRADPQAVEHPRHDEIAGPRGKDEDGQPGEQQQDGGDEYGPAAVPVGQGPGDEDGDDRHGPVRGEDDGRQKGRVVPLLGVQGVERRGDGGGRLPQHEQGEKGRVTP